MSNINTDKGITCYIDEMISTNNSINGIHNWDYTLSNLKSCRHNRNKYSHEVGTTEYDYFNPDEIDFLKEFRSLLLSAQDPLAILDKKRRFISNQRESLSKNVLVEQPIKEDNSGLIVFLTLAFIILFILVVVILFFALRPMLSN